MSRITAALANVSADSHRSDGRNEVASARSVAKGKKDESDESDTESNTGPGNIPIDDDAPILVYCRIRPSRGNAANKSMLNVDESGGKVEIRVPKAHDPLSASGEVNNSREQFDFQFSHIFGEKTTQEELFDGIGKRVVDNVIKGYNGTIFAYGQTGSGKTYSMTGGTDSYESRGLIPRALTYIFDWIAEHAHEYSVTMRISYLEIYNDAGYDLLDPQHEHKSLQELPRVTLMENDGSIHFRNLGELPASSVDEALNLLFVGDTNRVVCETPSNDASTRSHCIFMVALEIREIGGSKVRRSKLNLVDLAGSERIKKTNVAGKIRNEALHINVSLHYLEQVIVALHDASRGRATFIPYRNSMLTSVLRDSLGGNCKTVMLATLSPEKGHLDESISTSRFAQRVGMIKNRAELNEEVDPYVLVKQMKSQMRELKEELAAFRGQAKFQPLNEDERRGIQELVQLFLRDDHHVTFDEDGSGKFDKIVMTNPYKVRASWECWKELAGSGGATITAGKSTPAVPSSSSADPPELQRLQHENSLLTQALRILHGSAAESILKEIQQNAAASGGSGKSKSSDDSRGTRDRDRDRDRSVRSDVPSHRSAISAATPSGPPPPTPAEIALAKARSESFERFRRTYRKHSMIEEQKQTHSQKVEEARRIGENINGMREKINQTKHKIESHRLQRGVQTLSGDTTDESTALEPDSTELQLRDEIDRLKSHYRSQFDSLKHLKSEIDFLKNVIEKSRQQLQADFERWWQTQEQGGTGGSGSAVPSSNSFERDSIGTVASPSQSVHATRIISDAASIASNSGVPASSASSSFNYSRDRSSRGPADPRLGATSASISSGSSRHPPATVNAWSDAANPALPSSSAPLPAGLRTTGNSAADADIARFYEIKQQMLSGQRR